MSKQARRCARVLLSVLFLSTATLVAGPRDFGQREETNSSEPLASNGASAYAQRTQNESDAAKQEAKNAVVPSGYQIGAEDELQISVWKESDFSTTVVVRPDGVITLPLLNELKVIGLQPSELQNLLTEKLKPYVNDPHVTVIVRSIKSRKVFVYGSVMKPGAYQIGGSLTVLELLADAGGLSPFAKKGSIYVVRRVNNKQTKIHFNYKNALKGINPAENFELIPGDVLVVP